MDESNTVDLFRRTDRMSKTRQLVTLVGGPWDSLQIEVANDAKAVTFPVMEPGGYGQVVYTRSTIAPTLMLW